MQALHNLISFSSFWYILCFPSVQLQVCWCVLVGSL